MLADGLKSMSIGKKKAGANRKIDMADSSDEELALDTNGDIVGKVKPIFKKANYMFSRKRLQELKKEFRRLTKDGQKKQARKARKEVESIKEYQRQLFHGGNGEEDEE